MKQQLLPNFTSERDEMTTEWFPTGILDIKPFQLTDAQKQQLLKVIGKSEEQAGAFLNEIEKTIQIYNALVNLDEKDKPANVRKNIKAVAKAAKKLHETMDNLDGLSRELISESGLKFSEFYKDLLQLLNAVKNAEQHAKKFPTSKRINYSIRYLAAYVAKAMNDQLGLKPTSTRKRSKYAECLDIIIRAAYTKQSGSIPPNDIFDLTSKGIHFYETKIREQVGNQDKVVVSEIDFT